MRLWLSFLVVPLLSCSGGAGANYERDLECFAISASYSTMEVAMAEAGFRGGLDNQVGGEMIDQYSKELLLTGGAIGKSRKEISNDMREAAIQVFDEVAEFAQSNPSTEEIKTSNRDLNDDILACVDEL